MKTIDWKDTAMFSYNSVSFLSDQGLALLQENSEVHKSLESVNQKATYNNIINNKLCSIIFIYSFILSTFTYQCYIEDSV